MLVKNDVLSEFRNVRSYERIDLLCSLLDLCLPYELRFLGTCLEFLGKRDFYELREDERHANNVNHISQFRSLMDENTRRKLVLYVSFLKSCNSDCANCLNETLTTLCINDVSQICRSEPENAEKVLDELLLLYTIAVKHPAFNLHQKTEFAAHLSRLEEEDQRLSHILYSDEDGIPRSSRLFRPYDSIPDTPCQSKDLSSSPVEDQDSSSQNSVISQPNPLMCHMFSGSVYTNAVLPSSLNQASSACFNPTHVMVSSMCGQSNSPTCQPPANVHIPESAPRIGAETGHTVIAMGLSTAPVSSSLVMGPGMVMPVVPSTSHCIMPSSGELGMQKGSLGPQNLLPPPMVPQESIIVPYPGHAPWHMMVSIPGHISGPPLGCPCPSSSNITLGPPVPGAITPSKPATSSGLTPVPVPSSISMTNASSKSVLISYPSYCFTSPSLTTASSCNSYTSASPITTPKEDSAKPEDGERQESHPSSSPVPADGTSAPPSHKAQILNHSKGHSHSSHHPNHSLNLAFQLPNQMQQLHQFSSNMFSTPQQSSPVPPLSASQVANPVNPVQHSTNTSFPHPQLPQHLPLKQPGRRYSSGDNLKEVIVREMPKYKTNLQDFSPDELLHMGDEKLKEIGLSPSAVQQLRSIMSKLHSTNGINCVNRSEPSHNENSGSRRRHYHASDGKAAVPCMPGPGAVNCGFMVPMSHTGIAQNSTSNGGTLNKGSKRHQHLHLTNQVRVLQLEDDCRRPCSNSSSTSDCSSGSHSPPETPSLPHIAEVPTDHHFDRGYSGKDSGAESWNSGTSDDRNREDAERVSDEKARGPSYQPLGVHHSSISSRSRGLSKAPPGIPTIPRGRGQGHPMDKNRRDPVGSANGVPPEMNNPPSPYTMSGASGLPSNVPYSGPPVSSFLPHSPFPTMHTFHRFQPSNFLHAAGTTYPFPPNGEMWSQYPQPPHQTHPFITPIVAFSPAHPPPKLSCYNCGRQGHQGSDCKESTFEEITQQGQYHLDYKPYKEQGDFRDTDKQPYT